MNLKDPLQLLFKQNVDITLRMPILFKAARLYAGLTQTEAAKKLKIEQGTVSKIEAGVLNPTIDVWYFFCKLTEIPFESISYGFIDSGKLLDHESLNHKTGFRIPEKYVKYGYDTVRNLLPLIEFFIDHFGIKQFKKFIEAQKLDPLFFFVYDNTININFRIELVQFLMKKGLLTTYQIEEIFSYQAMPGNKMQCDKADVFSSQQVLSNYVNAQKYYQLDFQYALSYINKNSAELCITPESHLRYFDYRSEDKLGKFQCLYQKQSLVSHLSRTKKQGISIIEDQCHYLDQKSKSCVYKVELS